MNSIHLSRAGNLKERSIHDKHYISQLNISLLRLLERSDCFRFRFSLSELDSESDSYSTLSIAQIEERRAIGLQLKRR